jgi:hypothetical protein
VAYQNDPNRRSRREETTYIEWLICGAIAAAVILGVFMITGHRSNDSTAANSTVTTGR